MKFVLAPYSNGMIGAGALATFRRVGINSHRGELELELPLGVVADKKDLYRIPPAGQFLGLILVWRPDPTGAPGAGFMVASVAPDSAAERAGLRSGDRITSVNHLSTATSLSAARRLLWLADKVPVRVSGSRADGSVFEVQVP